MPCRRIWCPTDVEQEVWGVPDEGYAPYFFPSDGGSLVFRFTQESFLRVLSALQNGAYATYGDEGRQVIWDFLVNVEYPVTVCDAITDCIQNDPATMEAIVAGLKTSNEFNSYMAESISKATSELIGSKLVDTCDNSSLAGMVLVIVDIIDEVITDFLQQVEVGTNDEERIVRIVGAIPGVGALPADEILNMFQEFLTDFSENYASAITLSWRDEVSRALYCLAKGKPDCTLSFGDVFEYFRDRAGAELTLSSLLQNVVDFLIYGDFGTDDLIVSGMYTLALGFMMTGRAFAETTIQLLRGYAKEAPPSSIWEEWDPCLPPGERVPVINSEFDPPNEAGTITGPDVDGFWTVTSGTRGSDEAFTVMDAEGREFVLSEFTYSTTPLCQVLLLDNAIIYIGCTGTEHYVGQTLTEFDCTWPSGSHQTMRFKMLPP